MHQTLTLLASTLVVITFAAAQPVKNLESLKGKTVPDFRLRSVYGEIMKFSQFRGKVVLLNFWSPY